MKPIPYSTACQKVKHLLPDGCRFLKIGEPIPAGTRYISEDGIQTNTIGATKLAAIHHPHYVKVEPKSVSDRILEAFSAHIEDLNAKAKRFGAVGAYGTAAQFKARAEAMDEACGIAMRAVKS